MIALWIIITVKRKCSIKGIQHKGNDLEIQLSVLVRPHGIVANMLDCDRHVKGVRNPVVLADKYTWEKEKYEMPYSPRYEFIVPLLFYQ